MTFFNLYACCLLVKGITRSLICDVQRFKYILIPNDLYDLLKNELGVMSLEDIRKRFDITDVKVFDEYVSFLVKNEIGFLDDRIIKELDSIDLKYFTAEEITTCIIDFSENFQIAETEVSRSIDTLRIKYLQIRCFEYDFEELEKFMIQLNNSTVLSIELYISNSKNIKKIVKKLIDSCNKLNMIIVFNSNGNKEEKYKGRKLIYTVQDIKSEKCCGKVTPSYFTPNLETFTLSKNHNSCLYKKISVDSSGSIKNCPSMPHSFGNIKNTSLEEALNQNDFKKYWNLTKDHIEVCKVCEFRYICTDCRAYTERSHTDKDELDISKPLKCGYDPYMGRWEEWSTNLLKQKTIQYYELEDII